jgi:hypothetical protein
MNRNWMLGIVLAAVAAFGIGCDDTAETTVVDAAMAGGAGGGAGGTGGAGGGGEDATPTFVVTELGITTPGAPVGIVLRNLLNANINAEAIIIMMRLSDTTIEAGAAHYVMGQDTPDPSDDAFDWEVEGTCGDGLGGTAPCSVDVGNASVATSADGFVSDETVLNIYSSDLQAIVRLKKVVIDGAVGADGDVNASLVGVITQPDAARTPLELVPGAGYKTLEAVLNEAGVQPDQMVDDGTGAMVAAFTLQGSIVATPVTFQAE